MKILPISFKASNSNYDMNFLYTRKKSYDKDRAIKHYTITTAGIAILAVIIALFNISRNKRF